MPIETTGQALRGALDRPATPEGLALLDLLDKHLPRVRAEAHDNDRRGVFPAETFAEFGRDGIMGGTVPRELGGIGVGRLRDVAVVLSRVAEADASTALALHAQYSRGLTFSYEWRHGRPHAKTLAERVLRLMAAGDPVCGGVRGVATLSPDGNGAWLLSGRTTMVTMAPIAKHIIVLAQTRDDGGPPKLAAPLLAPGTPGLTVLDNWDGLGMRASGTVDILFEDAPVQAKNVLIRGPAGARGDASLAGQTVSSITMLGIYIGIAQAARDVTVGALSRATDPPAVVRTLVAEIDARLYTLRAALEAALDNADAISADPAQDPAERGRRMMLPFQYAKLMINKMAPDIVDDCLTLVGGAGYSGGHPLSRLYRDVRAGGFMQPYNYVDGVDFLSAQALGLQHENDYMSVRAARTAAGTGQKMRSGSTG